MQVCFVGISVSLSTLSNLMFQFHFPFRPCTLAHIVVEIGKGKNSQRDKIQNEWSVSVSGRKYKGPPYDLRSPRNFWVLCDKCHTLQEQHIVGCAYNKFHKCYVLQCPGDHQHPLHNKQLQLSRPTDTQPYKRACINHLQDCQLWADPDKVPELSGPGNDLTDSSVLDDDDTQDTALETTRTKRTLQDMIESVPKWDKDHPYCCCGRTGKVTGLAAAEAHQNSRKKHVGVVGWVSSPP
eukprot:TRINITY_DN60808_c0_g1_i1.p1 TRINITY_DN60808_c0_g1~~TRINITY_DN60808_c0_g1_i1.p1  ORF type:complete len:238 (-),score=7.92 TRINITY_DN60808_c0_g1_i1:20-733(-)